MIYNSGIPALFLRLAYERTFTTSFLFKFIIIITRRETYGLIFLIVLIFDSVYRRLDMIFHKKIENKKQPTMQIN